MIITKKAKRIYSLTNFSEKEELFENILDWEIEIQVRIDNIFKNITVFFTKNLKENIREIVERIVGNQNDAIILACAIQYHTDKEKVEFITIDKRHFKKSNISLLRQSTGLKKLKYDVPYVKYLTVGDIPFSQADSYEQ